MIVFLNEILMDFRSCFKRERAFAWFVITIIGFIVRTEGLGITSIIRDLTLNPDLYPTYLHFFRSSAWIRQELEAQWIKVVVNHAPILKICGMNILLGDGLTYGKEGRRMACVQKHHQESENSGKSEWVFGHLFGCVGILAGCPSGKLFCIVLSATIQVGANKIREFADPTTELGSHVVQLIAQAGSIAMSIGPSIIVLDRYFLSVPALIEAKKYLNLQIITKCKRSITAFFDPPPYSGKGRRRKKGASVKLMSLFVTEKTKFIAATVNIYGKQQDIEYYCVDLLWGQKLYQKMRFVLVSYDDTKSILVSTSLELSAVQIIELYSYRFKIEVAFKELVHTIGAWLYHFWSKYMPKLNKFDKKINIKALEAITDVHAKKKIVECLKAIEGYVMMALISMGLLQIFALKYSAELNHSVFRWLRTKTNKIVSEATMACYFRKNIFNIIAQNRHLPIMQIIIAKQNDVILDEDLAA